jgi:hypothetical protein
VTCLICHERGDLYVVANIRGGGEFGPLSRVENGQFFGGFCRAHEQEWVESGEFRRGPPAPTNVALADFVRRRQAERLNAGNETESFMQRADRLQRECAGR